MRCESISRERRPSEDKTEVGDNTLVDLERNGSLTAVFPNKDEGMIERHEKVAYVPDLAFRILSLVALHTLGVGFSTDDSDVNMTLLDGKSKVLE